MICQRIKRCIITNELTKLFSHVFKKIVANNMNSVNCRPLRLWDNNFQLLSLPLLLLLLLQKVLMNQIFSVSPRRSGNIINCIQRIKTTSELVSLVILGIFINSQPTIRWTCTNIQKALSYKLQCEGEISFCFILLTGSFPNHSLHIPAAWVCTGTCRETKTKSFSDKNRGECQDRNPKALFPNLLQIQIPEVKNWWSVMSETLTISLSVACQQDNKVTSSSVHLNFSSNKIKW